jgi:plastocyanin
MSLKMRAFWALMIFGPLLLLCGQLGAAAMPAPSAPTEAALAFNASEFKFNPASASAAAGGPTKVTLANTGSVDHTWVLLDKAGKEIVKLTAKPGATEAQSFTAPSAGTYDYICDVPGHKESGMHGTLTVR